MASSKKNDFDEIKFLKQFATRLNIGTDLIFLGNSCTNSIEVYFNATEPCLFRAVIQPNEPTKFSEWLIGGDHQISISTSDLSLLSKTLKANVLSIDRSSDGLSFEFRVLNKETKEEMEFIFKSKDNETIKKKQLFDEKVSIIKNHSHTLHEISNQIMERELLKLFNKNGEITEERTNDKVIEVPTYNLYCNFSKKERPCQLAFSNKDENGQRYVYINGEEEKTHLKFEMIFLTI